MKARIILLTLLLLSACGGKSNSEGENRMAVGEQCSPIDDDVQWQLLAEINCDRLGAFQLFKQTQNNYSTPQAPGISYQLATELFTDYAIKQRFLYIPAGENAQYHATDAFSFPVGTVLVKHFFLPASSGSEENLNLIETRLLIHRTHGWVGLPYIWDEQQQEAYLSLVGKTIPTSMEIQGDGINFDYQVPAVGDCKTCHILRKNGTNTMTPIRLKARHLNRPVEVQQNPKNQLSHWQSNGLLTALPEDISLIESIPVWGDLTRSLQDRAKGYLDINCSHCHSPGGSGSESGMYLEYWRSPEFFDHGICKRPGGFNGGDRGLIFDIVPGNADQSLIPYRMSLLASEGDEKGQMPPLARHLNHIEGIKLVSDWIDSMPARDCR